MADSGCANRESVKLRHFHIIIRLVVMSMIANDLTGNVYGTLKVLYFDSGRHNEDVKKRSDGLIDRVRRYYVCECLLCGKTLSVRGENLKSGNTKGCGCDAAVKTGLSRHEQHINTYTYDDRLKCWIGVANNTGNKFLIDSEDYDVVSGYCWYETRDGYMMTRLSRKKQISLHRLIAIGVDNIENENFVDHINRNRLDCRRSNLRLCTPKENAWNVGVHSNSMSGERGVRWHEKTAKWNAYITVDGRFKSLGYYDDKESAVLARRNAETIYRGEFAPI